VEYKAASVFDGRMCLEGRIEPVRRSETAKQRVRKNGTSA
jgi:hypothetical protein